MALSVLQCATRTVLPAQSYRVAAAVKAVLCSMIIVALRHIHVESHTP